MSTQAFMAFTEKVAGDEALQGKVKAIGAMESEQAERMAALGRENGFDFTPTEFLEVAKASRELNQGELSEAELETVSGTGTTMLCTSIAPQGFWTMVGLSVKNIQSIP